MGAIHALQRTREIGLPDPRHRFPATVSSRVSIRFHWAILDCLGWPAIPGDYWYVAPGRPRCTQRLSTLTVAAAADFPYFAPEDLCFCFAPWAGNAEPDCTLADANWCLKQKGIVDVMVVTYP